MTNLDKVPVLLVDDRPANLSALEELLKDMGLDIHKATSGNETLSLTLKHDFAIVLLDVRMPDMDGFETAELMRANPKTSRLPIIFVTAAMKDTEHEFKGYEAGAFDYLLKPVDPTILRSKVRGFCELYQQRRRIERREQQLELLVGERTAELNRTVDSLRESESRLRERVMLAELSASIGFSLTKQGDLRSMLQACSEALVQHLNVAFARIWTFNADDNVLELQSSAGLYTRIDGSLSRVPIGKFKIGLIAQERKPHTTNAVIGDPQVHDQEWAKREGLVAFAGHPLVIEDKLGGVMAMFSRHPLTDVTLKALASISNEIAIGIERKLAREKLAYLASIVEFSDDAIFSKTLDETIVSWNRSAERIYGYSAGEIVGQSVSIFVPPGLMDELAAIRERLKRGEKIEHLETTRLRKDGRLIHVALTISPIKDARGQMVGASTIARDITERKRAEALLRLQSAALEAAANAIVITDREGTINWINAAFTTLTGYSTAEVIGQNHRLLKSGKQDAAFYKKLWETILAGKVWLGEMSNRRKDGSLYTEAMTITPLKNERGDVTHFIAVKQDITQQKHLEEQFRHFNAELEQRVQDRTRQLEETNKELEAFSYSVSHDLRTPLRSIDGFSSALLEDYADKFDQEGKENLQTVRAASQRMGVLIDDMLRLSRISRSEMHYERVNLSEMVQQITAEFKKTDPNRAAEFIIAPDCLVDGDAALLRIAMENILSNAWKYTGNQAAAKIEFGTTSTNTGQAYFIRDNGCGFEMKYAGKLFNPFQRLHTALEFPGTGIGLASVQRVMRRHRGKAWIEGQVDHGTTLYFTLPGAGP